MMELKEIIGDYELFIEKVFSGLHESSIHQEELVELNHIGFRVKTESDYVQILDLLSEATTTHSKAVIRGREITLLRLNQPIEYGRFIIQYLEVLAPSSYSTYENGLEHAEFVIRDTFDTFIKKHNDVDFDLERIMDAENPEVGIMVEGITIKFHLKSLANIREERK